MKCLINLGGLLLTHFGRECPIGRLLEHPFLLVKKLEKNEQKIMNILESD